MKLNIKSLFVHFFVLVLFVIAALAYFNPVLQGKKIFQSDIAQYTGMAKEQNDYRKINDEEPYWTNSAFGGMPTYQLGANYPHNYVKKLDKLIRFLPRPADYLFLYFLGFYILLCCLKVDYRLAILGALAFGFSTYLIIILGVGHNAKAHALGYIPMLLGGIILTFRKKYFWGFVLSAIAMALEISANHFQMTYYFMLLVLILGVVYLVDAIKKKQLKHYFSSVGILILAVILGITANATNLLATKEYADWSTRGKSEITVNPDGSAKEKVGGLDKAYITHYSYGVTESLNLFVPRLFGGSNNEELGKKSKTYNYLTEQGMSRANAQDFTNMNMYWGDQPGTAGPAYVGAIILFLFVLGLFIVKGKARWWLLGGTLMSLFLSWGKNFNALTDFMIDYFPLYDKFRAVSSIQVILELCVPILAILALNALFSSKIDQKQKMKALKTSFYIMAGVGVLLLLCKGMFSFDSNSDATMISRGFPAEWIDVIKLDREAIYVNDTIRSLLYVLLAAVALWFFVKDKIGKNVVVIVLGGLILLDLVGIGMRYVNNDDFVRARAMNQPFQETPMDKQIAADNSVYRVYDRSEGVNGARTSYFHQSIGGYHAAKPAGMQELFEFHIYEGRINVLNMLNVKYVVQQDEEGRSYAATNTGANGNAWFIQNLKPVTSANEEILLLDSLDVKNEAIVNTNSFPDLKQFNFSKDSTASIVLTKYEPNHLQYTAKTKNDAVAVFSEMYYGHGWNAYINGKLSPHFKVNHVLRAIEVPAGEYKIEFKFQPKVVEEGSLISMISSIVLGIIILIGIILHFLPAKKTEES